MKKKIAIPVIILVGIIVIGLSALWQNGYLDMNTPVVYKYSDNCVFDGNFYYTVSDEDEDESEDETEDKSKPEKGTKKKNENKPKKDASDSPQTNDASNLLLWVALMFISGGGIMGNMLYGRKKKENEAN